MNHKVFIYGSLLPNQANHQVLEEAQAIFLTAAHSVEHIYAMYDDGDSPFLVIQKNNGGVVIGELYEVSEKGLQKITIFESAECERSRITVLDDNGKKHEAWIYLPFSNQYHHLRQIPVADWARRNK